MAINASDFNPASLSGTITINSSAGTSSPVIVADTTTEGPEKFVIKLRTGSVSGPVVATSGTITINDTSLDAVVPPVEPPVDSTPTYSLQANVASVSEGQGVRFTLVTTNLSNGNAVPYAISGVSSADIGGASLTGNFSISNNTASLDLAITADLATEGTETLTLRLTSAPSNPSVPITVVDSSVAPPTPVATYELTNAVYGSTPATTTTANEGVQALVFYLSINNASNQWGNDVPYTITGISRQDIGVGAVLGGSFHIPLTPTSNPVASVTYSITADQATEGVETLVMTLDGTNISTSVTILDTSTTPALPPTYNLTSTTRSYGPTNQQVYEYVNPPGSAYVDFILNTTNIVPGTQVPFTISGIQQGDVTSPGLTWNAAISKYTGAFVMQTEDGPAGYPVNNQFGKIKVDIVADALTEGNETMELSLDNGQASVAMTIVDNSLSAPAVFTVTPASSSVNEGSPMIYTVGGSNIINGTYYWTIQNSMNFLNDFGTFSGSFTITNNAGTFSVTPSADLLTEGSEAFSIELRTGSATGPVVFTGAPVTINDTSVPPVITGSATISAANTRSVPTTLPAAATWVAFRVIGAGGSGGGPDGSGAGGSGGGAQYAKGIVKLPATSGPKTIYGFAGRPGRGGRLQAKTVEDGGIGENCTPAVSANGAIGQAEYSRGSSGGGGAGGGGSSLYFQKPDGTFVPIVFTGGGGGGGGGTNRRGDYGNANWDNKGFITFGGGITGSTVGNGLVAIYGGADGGAGGGGGGGAGAQGYAGHDNNYGSKGGSAGYVIRNDNDGLTWSTFDWYGIGPVPPASEGVAVDAPQPFPWVSFGRGGIGAVYDGVFGQGGQMGAIAIYWTTAETAPDYSNVPDWAYPAVTIPAGALPNRDMQASSASGVNFYSWGSVSYNIDGNISTSCFIMSDWGNDPINGIGEFLEIRITSAAPSNGLARGGLNSNIVENTWTPLKPMASYGYYITSTENYLDVTVSIRRRDNQAVLRTVTYYNLTQPSGYVQGVY